MMTPIQVALLAGALIASPLVILLWHRAPQRPSLEAYFSTTPTTSVVVDPSEVSFEDRLGFWVERVAGRWINIPGELELLQIPRHRFLAQKLSFALVGLLFPSIAAVLLGLLGLSLPIGIPVLGSIALAVGLSFVPDFNAHTNAKAAREEFAFVLGSYMDLVALDRRSGTSPRQAMEQAAMIGDSWVFRRIGERIADSRLNGLSPWNELAGLGERYLVPELTELTNIMRVAESQNTSIYETLKERSKASRKAHLAKELTEANKKTTSSSAPIAMLGILFTVLLITPALLSVLAVAQ